MNYLDFILLAIMAVFLVMGIKRGFCLTCIQLVGILVVVILIRQFGVLIRNGLHTRLGIPEVWALIIGYLLIFILVMVLAKLISYYLQKLLSLIKLGWIDRVLGGFLGLIFGIVFVVMLVLFAEVSSLANQLGDAPGKSRVYAFTKSLASELLINIMPHLPGDFDDRPAPRGGPMRNRPV